MTITNDEINKTEDRPVTEIDLISACFTRWPDMARYADTACVESIYDVQRDEWREMVTVTVFKRDDGCALLTDDAAGVGVEETI